MNKSKTFFWSSIDFWLQSMLIAVNLICMTSSLYSIQMLFIGLIVQIFIGFYQYIASALPYIVFQNYISEKIKYQRQSHFYLSSFFLIIFFLSLNFIEKALDLVNSYLQFGFMIIGVFIIPQILMYFYFYITYQQKELEQKI